MHVQGYVHVNIHSVLTKFLPNFQQEYIDAIEYTSVLYVECVCGKLGVWECLFLFLSDKEKVIVPKQ